MERSSEQSVSVGVGQFDPAILNEGQPVPPDLHCQGRCGIVHARCYGNPNKGVCVLTEGHPRPHRCSYCNQVYM
jgi:hypothetical protein